MMWMNLFQMDLGQMIQMLQMIQERRECNLILYTPFGQGFPE